MKEGGNSSGKSQPIVKISKPQFSLPSASQLPLLLLTEEEAADSLMFVNKFNQLFLLYCNWFWFAYQCFPWDMVTFGRSLINSIIGAANDLSSVFSWHLDPPFSCHCWPGNTRWPTYPMKLKLQCPCLFGHPVGTHRKSSRWWMSFRSRGRASFGEVRIREQCQFSPQHQPMARSFSWLIHSHQKMGWGQQAKTQKTSMTQIREPKKSGKEFYFLASSDCISQPK